MEVVDSDSFSNWSTLRQSFEGKNITGPTHIGKLKVAKIQPQNPRSPKFLFGIPNQSFYTIASRAQNSRLWTSYLA